MVPRRLGREMVCEQSPGRSRRSVEWCQPHVTWGSLQGKRILLPLGLSQPGAYNAAHPRPRFPRGVCALRRFRRGFVSFTLFGEATAGRENGSGLAMRGVDMHGNLWECCQDYYEEKSYEKTSLNDPNGPATGSTRVLRGGHWYSSASNCRSAYRGSYQPSYRNNNSGFRCVREQSESFATTLIADRSHKAG